MKLLLRNERRVLVVRPADGKRAAYIAWQASLLADGQKMMRELAEEGGAFVGYLAVENGKPFACDANGIVIGELQLGDIFIDEEHAEKIVLN